jgi:methionyl-tRNA formyltransferase
MRVVFVGVVLSARPAFEALVDQGADIVGLFTADIDAAVAASSMGRSYYADLRPLADEKGIPVHLVEDINDHIDTIRALAPDIIYVVGWPQIVRASLLELAPCIGMHPSKLPERRGGAPLNWQLLDGETESAVSLIRFTEGIDDGDVLEQAPFGIPADAYIEDVIETVCAVTYDAVAKSFPRLADGTAAWVQQDHSASTCLRRRTPEDGIIPWRDSARRIFNLVRAVSHPFPGAWTLFKERKVTIWRANIPTGYKPRLKAPPGKVIDRLDGAIVVSCRDFCVAISELQFEGERTIRAGEAGMDEAYGRLAGKSLRAPAPKP